MTAVIDRGTKPSLQMVLCSAYLHPYDPIVQYDPTCGFPLAPPLNAGQSSLEASAIETGDGLIFATGLYRYDVTCCYLS